MIGQPPWVHLADQRESDRLQAALLRVIVSTEPQTVDVAFPHAGSWRLWLHHVPLQEVRVAEYARKIPPQLTLLTEQEKRICKRLAGGEHTPDIADALYVSRSTISAHRANIARKLSIETAALVSWCGGHAEWF